MNSYVTHMSSQVTGMEIFQHYNQQKTLVRMTQTAREYTTGGAMVLILSTSPQQTLYFGGDRVRAAVFIRYAKRNNAMLTT